IILATVLAAVVPSAQTEQTAKPPAQKASPRTAGQTPTGTTARRSVGAVTFAVAVADPAGAALGEVKVTVQGPATREGRTENGRIAFENLPAGSYRLRFEHEGFVTLERELTGRGGSPMDVKVTLTPAPEPPKPPPAPEPAAPPPAPTVKAETVALDI